MSFDGSVSALYGCLLSGGQLCLGAVDDENLPALAARAGGFTFLKATPSHLPLLARLPASCVPSGQMVVGGEAVPAGCCANGASGIPVWRWLTSTGRPRRRWAAWTTR